MVNLNIFICLFTCFILVVHSLPLDATTAQPDEKIAFFVPYAIQYVPVEIPDEYINKNLAIPTHAVFNEEDFLRKIQEQNPDLVINTKDEDDESLLLKEHNADTKNKHSSDSALQNNENFVIVPQAAIDSPINTFSKSDLKNEAENPDLFNKDSPVVIPVKETFVATVTKNVNTPSSTESVDASTSAKTESQDDPNPIPTESAEALKASTTAYTTVENVPSTSSKPHVISKRQAQGFYYRPVVRYSSIRSRRRRIQRPSRRHAMVGYLSDRDLFPTVA